MKLGKSIKSPLRNRGGGRIAFVHWDRDSVDFLICTPKVQDLPAEHVGSIPWGQFEHPLLALAEHFKSQSISVQQIVLLMTRPNLDLLTLNLPAAEESELPELVAIEAEQKLGDAEEPPAVDYYVVHAAATLPATPAQDQPETSNSQADSATDNAKHAGHEVLAFAMPAAELQQLKERAEQAGFRLIAITPRHLAPLGILRRRHIPSASLAISVHLYAGEAELAICRGAEPLFLRTLRISRSDPQRVAEQISTEVSRCLTLLPPQVAELPMGWFVFTTNELAWQVAQALEDRDSNDVQPVDPLIGWNVETSDLAGENLSARQLSAANAGAAWDHRNQGLPVNLLAPKKAPPPPNPVKRWALIGTAAAVVVGVGVYFALSDIRQLKTQVQELEGDLEGAEKLAAKYQEKADQVDAVESWLANRVDWLEELSEVSRRLPQGNQATVSSLTASTRGGAGVIDLSVQVAEQDQVSILENRIRSVKYSVTSQRISQKSESAEYPWQFETRVTFPIEGEQPASDNAPRYAPLADSNSQSSPTQSTDQSPAEMNSKNNSKTAFIPTSRRLAIGRKDGQP